MNDASLPGFDQPDLLASLEAMGLVKRSIDERDRRRTIVRLTDAGTERMAAISRRSVWRCVAIAQGDRRGRMRLLLVAAASGRSCCAA